MGQAFGRIISSLVRDNLMPPLGYLINRANFSDLFVTLSETYYATIADARKAGVQVIGYGLLINAMIGFLIVAFALFLVIRQFNRLRRPAPPAPDPETKQCPYCVSTIPLKATRLRQCTTELKPA